MGDVGSSPTNTETGFSGANSVNFVSGANHNVISPNDATTQLAQTNLTTAYNDAANQAPNTSLTVQDLGGLTLVAGVYSFGSSAQLTGTLTLDAQGNPNSVFIFQIGSTLTTASASTVKLINGAQSCHVFWQIGSSATLGTTTTFVGNILALTSITLNTGATVDGSVLARNGAVTMDSNTITRAVCNAAPLISVAKTATPTALTAGAGSVTYDYTVTNIGTSAMSNITIADNKCPTVSYVSGDNNSDSKLDLTETWKYHCTATLTSSTTNIVTVTGLANSYTATATASTTVVVSGTAATTTTTAGAAIGATVGTAATTVNPTTTTVSPKLPNAGKNSGQSNIIWDIILAASSISLISGSIYLLGKKRSV